MATKKLPWEYCECGCHCLVATVGPYSVTLFDSLRGKVYVWTGGCRSKMYEPEGTYPTFEEASKAARKLMREQLKKDAQALKAWL
jgi:hypothetical protein